MDRSEEIWESSILPSLSDFIEIKALSPLFEPNWAEMGELDATIELFCEWLDDQGIEGMSYEKHRIGELSPVLIVTIEGTGPGEVIFYSHLDKQPSKPELWSEGLHPLKAVRRDPWLYGRGSVDDGYGGYLCATSVRLLQEAGAPHPRCTMIIETCEESGSFDLPPYLEALSERLGNPDMVVVLDSGGPDYDHIWMTEALRGLVSGTLSVKVSHEGIHSGNSGGLNTIFFQDPTDSTGQSGGLILRKGHNPGDARGNPRRSQGERNLPQGYSRRQHMGAVPNGGHPQTGLRNYGGHDSGHELGAYTVHHRSRRDSFGAGRGKRPPNEHRPETELQDTPWGRFGVCYSSCKGNPGEGPPIWGRGHIHS